jgi:membrane-associated phospholipid phosphatase
VREVPLAITRPGAFLRALCFLALPLPVVCTAQTHHDLRVGREVGIVATGFAFQGIGLLLAHQNTTKPAPVIDIGQVPPIDRIATRQWSLTAHRQSDLLFGVAVAASLAGSIVNQNGERPLLPVAIIAESSLLCSGLTNSVKELVRRPRPYMYNSDVPPSYHDPDRDYVSFWSGHTANTAAITFSTACMVQRSDASQAAKTWTWVGAAAVPAAMGYLRVKSGRHFPTDVLTGYIVGALVGIVVPYFHRAEMGTPGN